MRPVPTFLVTAYLGGCSGEPEGPTPGGPALGDWEPGTPILILDSNGLPELSEMRHLQRFQHRLVGRVWVLDTDLPRTKRILLMDTDNDGDFDGSPLVGDAAWFETLGLEHYEDWDSLRGP